MCCWARSRRQVSFRVKSVLGPGEVAALKGRRKSDSGRRSSGGAEEYQDKLSLALAKDKVKDTKAKLQAAMMG